jgi:mono/diheme cytochrome c family protein
MPKLVRILLCAAAFAAGATGAARAETTAAGPGDARRGEALYIGTARLAGGGAPCLACHGVAGHGLARAASFGPDLTASHEVFGGDGLDALLEDMSFPSMEPVYQGRTIGAQERADLVAFLADAAGSEPPRLGAGFAVGVLGAMGAFLGVFLIVGKRGEARRARPAATRGTR